MLTNKKLSEGLDIPLYKIRRWTKELLPPDPKATRRSGHAREFPVNDGFFVALGGYLVSRYNYVFYEVRNILEQLKPYLLKTGLVPEIPDYAIHKGIEKKIKSLHEMAIYEFREQPGEFYIKGRGPINREVSQEVDSSGRAFALIKIEEAEYWIVRPPQTLLDKWRKKSEQTYKKLIRLKPSEKMLFGDTDQLGWMDYPVIEVERQSALPIYNLLESFFFRFSEIKSFWEWQDKFWALNTKSFSQ
jgi:hypothetical protein